MPTINSTFSANLVDQTKAKVTWSEADVGVDPNISTSLSAVLIPLGVTLINTSLSAHLTSTYDGGRDVTSSLVTALTQDVISPFFALDLEFDSGSLYFWTGAGEVTIDGKTYLGTGNLLEISDVEETAELAAKGATLTLSGVPSTILSLALTEPYQGRPCRIYFGVTGDLTEYTEVFSGYMDQMNIAESGQTSTIELTVENKLVDLEKPRSARFTSAYQKSVYPGDKGLDFVEDLQDKNIVWGRKIKE